MSDSAKSPADITAEKAAMQRGPRNLLSILRIIASVVLVIAIIACAVGIALARYKAEKIGFDIANVATFALTVLALIAFVPLILLQTKFPLFTRLVIVSVLVLVVCLPILVLRVDGFDGRLVPILRWAWDAKQEPLAAPKVTADTGDIDLATTTPHDFPQFLGPNRDLNLPNIQLELDWKANPPEQLWRKRIGAGWSGFSVVNGYAVTLEQRGELEVVSCYSMESGDIVWAHSNTARHETVMGGLGPRSTPTIDEGFVYTLGANGLLQCINGANGELVWSDDLQRRCGVTPEQDLKAISWGRSASPLVVDDLLIVPLGGPPAGQSNRKCHSLAAYDKRTGDLRWLGGDSQAGYASPSLATLCGIDQIVIVNESSVSGHQVADGEVLWSHRWIGQSNAEANCSQAVVVPDNRIVLTNRRKAALLQLSPTDDGLLQAEVVWESVGKLKTKFTNVVVRDGYVYGLSDGLLECVELSTGKRSWKSRRGDYGHGQILGVGNVLLVQAESGEVVLVEFNPDKLVELSRLEAMSERTWNTPCLFGSMLLVRNASEAACYRVKLRAEQGREQ